MNILLLSYMVSPYRGSEYSVSWNHIKYLSKFHNITVLYGTSGNHLGDDDDIKKYIHEFGEIDNVNFVFVPSGNISKCLNYLNTRNIFKYSFYLAYRYWHKDVLNYVRDKLNINEYDIVHYLNPIGFREPGYLYKLDKPYIWGPIGGAPNVNVDLIENLPLKERLHFRLKNFVNLFQFKFSRRLKNALSNTTVLLTATSENKKLFLAEHNKTSIYLPENGTVGNLAESGEKTEKSTFNIIWIGSVDSRKNINLLLDALNYLPSDTKYRVDVIGDGPLFNAMIEKSNMLDIGDKITWHGNISREQVFNLFENSDVHILTSINEGNPTVIWEAMSFSVPTISLDICGMHDSIKNNSGYLIPVSDHETMARNISNIIFDLSHNDEKLSSLKTNVSKDFCSNHWSNRAEFYNELYNNVKLGIDTKNMEFK
ncbi:glycosyltransferase family 4 protein [Photobacterium ganghwense]|uniref:glycosyltransferase family 4 protein n=1 Tax=Photobacterium ganghwense TaxID=320778 RepID=UPI004055CA2F